LAQGRLLDTAFLAGQRSGDEASRIRSIRGRKQHNPSILIVVRAGRQSGR
jgi:hypothetical protein